MHVYYLYPYRLRKSILLSLCFPSHYFEHSLTPELKRPTDISEDFFTYDNLYWGELIFMMRFWHINALRITVPECGNLLVTMESLKKDQWCRVSHSYVSDRCIIRQTVGRRDSGPPVLVVTLCICWSSHRRTHRSRHRGLRTRSSYSSYDPLEKMWISWLINSMG